MVEDKQTIRRQFLKIKSYFDIVVGLLKLRMSVKLLFAKLGWFDFYL